MVPAKLAVVLAIERFHSCCLLVGPGRHGSVVRVCNSLMCKLCLPYLLNENNNKRKEEIQFLKMNERMNESKGTVYINW